MNQNELTIINGLIPSEFLPHPQDNPAQPGFQSAHIDIKRGLICKVDHQMPLTSDCPVLDATDCIILPGFIDVHIHGALGSSAMEGTAAAFQTMADYCVTRGVTAFLPTTATAPHRDILLAAQAVAEHQTSSISTTHKGARILGTHIEGPYISPVFPGAQPAAYIRPPDLVEFNELAATGAVRMITLAPEVVGAQALIQAACEQHIVAVIGHTDASYEQCEAAIAYGANQATHTYNAMLGLHHRRPGTLGAILSNDQVYAQLIADNIHVHPAAMNILARCKGPARTILITDAIQATGLEEGEYTFAGQQVTVQDGACRLADGTLAGSVLTMDRALINFMAATGLSLADAWPTTSRTPAQSLGLGHRFGEIAPGYQADLVLLNDGLDVMATVVDGEVAYSTLPNNS